MLIKLSIITINFNNLSGLKKTFFSVTSQSNLNFQYIIIDGGSSDGSQEFLKEKDNQIDFWVSEKDAGIYNAMNKGILAAKGEYLLFLNSGDYLANTQVIDNAVSHLEHSSGASIIYGDLYIEKANESLVLQTYPDKPSLEFFLSGSLPHPSTFIQRSVFDKVGLFDESFKIVSDWIFFFTAFVRSGINFKHISLPISVFTEGGLSTLLANQNYLQHERYLGLRKIFSEDFINLIERYNNYTFYWKKYYIGSFTNLMQKVNKLKKLLLAPFKKGMDIIHYYFQSIHSYIAYRHFKKANLAYTYTIPIIINNRNRLSTLIQLINSLTVRGYNNISIIDNNSTYPQLLEWYKTCKYKIYYLQRNVGFCALWDSSVYKNFEGYEYIYTDSDVVLSDNCSDDIICKMLFYLKKYKSVDKVGLGLLINDLPDYFSNKKKVIAWESELVNNAQQLEQNLILAPVDTTFALYRKNKIGPAASLKSVRLMGDNQIRHLPWYLDTANIDEEEQYYLNEAETLMYTHWTGMLKN